tara:strand:+ start:8431 stop:8853 length:423 start_codon:yes stop_codon:yes gene_type:complete
MAYPPHIDRKKIPSTNLAENISAGWQAPIPVSEGYNPMPGWEPPSPSGSSSSGSDTPMGAMGGIGALNPWGLLAIPATIGLIKGYNYLTGDGKQSTDQPYGRPGDPPHRDDGLTKQAADMFTRGYEKGGIFDEAIYGRGD